EIGARLAYRDERELLIDVNRMLADTA
ncbi:MAG: hypothetical protein JWN20_2434, partial [Jatrophihabitantaceae bacterium]|nr:hypothetical protein [Jatrophihabitantaceae bacterium]